MKRMKMIVWMWFSIISLFIIWAIWGAMAWGIGFFVSGTFNPWEWDMMGRVLWLILGAGVGFVMSYTVIKHFYFDEAEGQPKK